jgi:hypothetical protein
MRLLDKRAENNIDKKLPNNSIEKTNLTFQEIKALSDQSKEKNKSFPKDQSPNSFK